MNKKHYNQHLIIFFILLLTTIGQMAVDIYLPSMPFMVNALRTTDEAVQHTLTAYLLGFAFSQLIYGPLADHFGRRPVLLSGLVIFLCSSLACSATNSIHLLLLARLLQGLGIGSASVLSRAIMRDVFHGPQLTKLSSYVAMAWATVPIVAPLLGGYIQHYLGWRVNFVFLSLVSLISILLVFFKLPETLPNKQAANFRIKKVLRDYLTLLSNRLFLGYVISVMVLYGAFVAFNIAGPFLLQSKLNMSAIQYGWAVVFVAFGYMLGSFITGQVSKKHSTRNILLVGILSFVLFSVIMMLIAAVGVMNISVILIPMFLILLSIGLIYPHYIAGSLSPFPHIAGSAGALFGFMVFIGGTFSSMVVAKLPEQTQLPLSSVLLFESLLVLLIFASILFHKNKWRKGNHA